MNRPSQHPRDQHATPFAEILRDLCLALGAKCAALVDFEGETVDYGGEGDPFDIRIIAAEWRLIMQRLNEGVLLGSTQEMIVRARKKSFLVLALPQGYALVIELGRRASTASERALCHASKRLCHEAGFGETSSTVGDWTSVMVQEEPGDSRRPLSLYLGDEHQAVTILGRISLPQGENEHGFRVRLSSGEERTLVREPFGHWYIEEDEWVPFSQRPSVS
jgi:hypothetical protein